MNLRVLDEAAAELAAAIARYESIESGLGVRLKEEVKSATDWISVHPELPRVRSQGHRRLNLRIFPYYIAFLVHEEEIWVLAVAHPAKLPEYWITRPLP